MLDCSRMSHRVHTILSILAEDHAPAALRPLILLAVDWPTVAEESPATAEDDDTATIAAAVLGGSYGSPNFSPAARSALTLLAARLATVAASLTATGDKAMAAHATALWGAAAALVGMPTEVREVPLAAPLRDILGLSPLASGGADIKDTVRTLKTSLDALATKAADIIPSVTATGTAEKATLIATALDRVREYRNSGATEAFGRGVKIREALGIMPGADILGALAILRETLSATNGIGIMSAASMQAEKLNLARQGRDKALGDIHALRDILKVPEGGNLVDIADAVMRDHDYYRAENTRLRAQVDRMIAAMREDAPLSKPQTMAEARPQPGDVVPWSEVEDGALYARTSSMFPFRAVVGPRHVTLDGPDDRDLSRLLANEFENHADELRKRTEGSDSVLVARDLGTDPEAWRRAMREWTANGNKPTSKAAPKAAEDVRPLRDEFTRSIDLTGVWMCLMTGPLGNNGARWSLETTIGDTNNLRMRWPSGCTTTLKDPR